MPLAALGPGLDKNSEKQYEMLKRMIGKAEGPRGLKFEGEDGWIFIHIHGAKLECNARQPVR